MSVTVTGTWKYFSPFLAFRDGQLIHNGYSSIQCRPWVTTDGVTRTTIYTDMLTNRYYDYWYGWQLPTHSIKYTQLYAGLTIIPTNDLLADYNINNYLITPALTTYTNTHTYSFDEATNSNICTTRILMTNNTDSVITVSCFAFKKNVAVSRGEEGGTTYADALMMAFYLNIPIEIPAYSSATHTVTVRTGESV